MENLKEKNSEQRQRFALVAYHTVMLVAFVIGLYGLLSLFSLVSVELQHSVQNVGSLP